MYFPQSSQHFEFQGIQAFVTSKKSIYTIIRIKANKLEILNAIQQQIQEYSKYIMNKWQKNI